MTIYLGHHQIDQKGPGALKLFLESLNETSSNIFPLSSLGIEVCLAQSVSPTYLLFLALSESPGTTSPFSSFSTLNILKLQKLLSKFYLFFFTNSLDLGFVLAGLTWSALSVLVNLSYRVVWPVDRPSSSRSKFCRNHQL